jgi:5-methylcytosine-specific restriction endonuclease McrA
LLRDLDIAGKLGCLTPDNLERLRDGTSPVISRGPYTGEAAEVDHIVPIAREPLLGNEIANLESLPRTLNRRKGARMGEQQRNYLEKYRAADLVGTDLP